MLVVFVLKRVREKFLGRLMRGKFISGFIFDILGNFCMGRISGCFILMLLGIDN